MRIETLAVHAGLRVDLTTGAVAPALHTATTFEHEPDSTAPRGFLYSRNANPNRNALEECLAALEGGAEAAAFASASAATAAVFQALAPGAPPESLLSGRYDIDVAGVLVPATVSVRAWHDPAGARLRA